MRTGPRSARRITSGYVVNASQPCVWRLKDRRAPDPAFAKACKQWADPRYFSGVWSVGIELSNFRSWGTWTATRCRIIHASICGEKRSLAPDDRDGEFEPKFVGRRSRQEIAGHRGSQTFAVMADKVIYARRSQAPDNWIFRAPQTPPSATPTNDECPLSTHCRHCSAPVSLDRDELNCGVRVDRY